MGQRHGSRGRQSRRFDLSSAVMGLEARRMLDGGASASFVDGYGWLQIHGTEAADRISLVANEQGIRVEVRSIATGEIEGSWSYKREEASFAQIFGKGGDDEITVDGGNVMLVHAFGQEGDDLLIGGSSRGWYAGGPGNDRIQGGSASEILTGEEGNDVIKGGGGDDWIAGGEGDDALHGGAGDDTILDNEGVNEIVADDPAPPAPPDQPAPPPAGDSKPDSAPPADLNGLDQLKPDQVEVGVVFTGPVDPQVIKDEVLPKLPGFLRDAVTNALDKIPTEAPAVDPAAERMVELTGVKANLVDGTLTLTGDSRREQIEVKREGGELVVTARANGKVATMRVDADDVKQVRVTNVQPQDRVQARNVNVKVVRAAAAPNGRAAGRARNRGRARV